MTDTSNHGEHWTDAECDAVVADYFAMLAEEAAGRPYVKRRYAERTMAATGRTHRSVEFKYMNVSAALEALHLPRIRGYRPMENIQRALVDAIARWLVVHPEFFEIVLHTPNEPGDHRSSPLGGGGPRSGGGGLDYPLTRPEGAGAFTDPAALYLEPPSPLTLTPPTPRAGAAELTRLVRKFDPVERDARNRQLGKADEALILDFERRRLERADRPDLARKVRWVAQEDGDGAGYDIRSYDLASGAERWIEVKTTRGPQKTPFLISRNECAMAEERPDLFRLYRVYAFGEAPKLYELTPPLAESVVMRAEVWRAGFG